MLTYLCILRFFRGGNSLNLHSNLSVLSFGKIMTRLIKKYKNRRLYDTETSQYITVEQLQRYVVDGLEFRIEDSVTGKDLTNSVFFRLLSRWKQGLHNFCLRKSCGKSLPLANHPMQSSLKAMMEQMFQIMEQPIQNNPYKQVTETWNQQIQKMVQQWQGLFKG